MAFWGALLGAGASLLGGLTSSRSQSRATDAQLRANQESLAAQERMANRAMAQQDRYYNEMLASQYPRQRAGNAALQQLTDLYGLGDIYASPSEGSLGGGAQFYPGAPMATAPGVYTMSQWQGTPESYRVYLQQLAENPSGRYPGYSQNQRYGGLL